MVGGRVGGWLAGRAGRQVAGGQCACICMCVCVTGYYIFYSTLSELGSVLNFHSCVRKFPT